MSKELIQEFHREKSYIEDLMSFEERNGRKNNAYYAYLKGARTTILRAIRIAEGKPVVRQKPVEKEQYGPKTWSIWREGFKATGINGKASLLGWGTGETFKDACDDLARKDQTFRDFYDPDRLTYWGCRLHDNEHKARAKFG
ncbi:hypothetical protein D1872_81890 [compost metagenome]